MYERPVPFNTKCKKSLVELNSTGLREKSVSHTPGAGGDNNGTQGGEPMDVFSSPGRILEELNGHFSAEELETIRMLLQVEAWASPSSRSQKNTDEPFDIPLRYHLEIELNE